MRREPGSSGSRPCRWGPPPPVWTDKVVSVMDTQSPLRGRSLDHTPRSGGLCPASCPIWGIPRWKADLNFCFYIFSQLTGPARRFPSHRRMRPLKRSHPQPPRAAIHAQDSWRTTEEPYNKIPAALSVAVCVFASPVDGIRVVAQLPPTLRSCALKFSVFTHGFASPSAKRHKFLSHLAACLSVCRCFHVTRQTQVMIGQAGVDRCACGASST